MIIAAGQPHPANEVTPTAGAPRLLRVVALGATSLLLAGGAHLVGGGRLPSVGLLSIAALLLGLVALVVTVRRCRLPLLLVVLGVEQILLHLVFDAATVSTRCSSVLDGAGMAGSGVAGHLSHSGAAVAQMAATGCSLPDVGMGAAMAAPGWLMWAAHLTATVLTAWLLARGEAWLWRVADRFVAVASAAPATRPTVRRDVLAGESPLYVPGSAEYSPAAPRGPPALVGS